MKPHRIAITSLLLLVFTTTAVWAQTTPGRRVPEFASRQEYVSLDSSLAFDRAIAALNELSKRFSGKIIIDPLERTNPIGVSVRGLHWRDALDIIAETNGLRLLERPDYIEVRSPRDLPGTQEKPTVTVDTREVLVTTIFFSLDIEKSLAYGIDWSFSFLRGKDTLLGSHLSPPTSKLGLDVHYGRPHQYGDFMSTLRLFSQNGLGEVISSPKIIVRSEETGRVQVGQDISITRRDITPAGTFVSTVQIPTGTIVTVKPEIIKEGDIEYIYLELEIERSNAITLGDAPTIDRNSTKTSLLLIDGEEVFLSGLYFNQENVRRAGIPVLKDLPWWFFGLRYLFGSDERSTIRRELAILLKVELLPSLRERAARRIREENVLERMRQKFQDDVDRLKTGEER